MNSSGETSWLNIFHLQRADPQTPWDLAFGVGVGSALTLLQLAVVAVSLLRYREPAIKFRQPLLMLCSILSNFAFFIGFCVRVKCCLHCVAAALHFCAHKLTWKICLQFSNDLIKQTSHATCTIFNIWFLMLGLTAWLSCNSARLAYLWTVFRSGGATSNGGMQTSNARRQDIKTVVVCAVLMIPMIIYCISKHLGTAIFGEFPANFFAHAALPLPLLSSPLPYSRIHTTDPHQLLSSR